MDSPMTEPNDDQIAFWNGEAGQRWVDGQEAMDVMLAPFGRAALDAAAIGRGAEVVDIGCGCGGTTLEVAERVGLMGRVLAVDISTPMLRRAQERATAAGLTNVTCVNADASTYRFEAGAFDRIVSRFGVMFFRNAEAAFANMHAALCEGGRMAFVSWRGVAGNEWVTLPRDIALRHVPAPPPLPPGEPGPFAFADPDRVRGILEAGGFRDVSFEALDLPFRHEGSVADVARGVATMGPASRLIAEADEATRARIVVEIAEAIAPRHDGRGLDLGAEAWVVAARR